MRCRNCEEVFKQKREWQLFCKPKCKMAFNRATREYCFYCGEYGNHRDHIHPVNLRGLPRRFLGQEVVWACNECNATLNDNMFPNVVNRVDFLIKSYEQKYEKELGPINWTEEDLEELGPMLRGAVKAGLTSRRVIENRLKYLYNVRAKLLILLVDDEQEFSYQKENKEAGCVL